MIHSHVMRLKTHEDLGGGMQPPTYTGGCRRLTQRRPSPFGLLVRRRVHRTTSVRTLAGQASREQHGVVTQRLLLTGKVHYPDVLVVTAVRVGAGGLAFARYCCLRNRVCWRIT